MDVFIVLTPGFPSNEEDTSCLPAFQQFTLSVKKLYPEKKLLILSFQYPFEKKKYKWNGIDVIAIGGSNKPGLKRFLTWLKAYKYLRGIKKENEIAGLLSLWLTECSLVAKYFAWFNGLKHYMWLIGQDAKQSNQYIKRIKARGANIIAMSDFLKEEYYKNHKELPFLVAENGINESAFPALNTAERKIDILGVGSLIKLKNYSLFIEIISDLKKTLPSIKVVIVGVGEEEINLKSLVKELNLQDNIEFAGLIPHSVVFDYMNNSKAFLHTSNYEGNSTVLMEALYSGCYTFSTCPLSNSGTSRLTILKTRKSFVSELELLFKKEILEYKRIVFNTMDASTKKIMRLFLS